MNPILTKNFEQETAVDQYSIVKFGTTSDQVVKATAHTESLIGIVGDYSDNEAGKRVDVVQLGIAFVELGGTVAKGDIITADADGHAVKVTNAMVADGDVHIVGFAQDAGVDGDIISVDVKPAVVTANAVAAASYIVGAEATNAINVAIQLKDFNAADLAERAAVMAYLSDDANGDSVIATAHSSGGAIGTDGLAIPLVANKCWLLTSESDGDIDITFTEAGAKTSYLVIVLPNGTLSVSGAITFA